MSVLPTLVGGIAYFMLGGLWFTPLFGKQWDRAVGFDRPAKWKPSAIYYIGPLIGCLVGSAATGLLIGLAPPSSLPGALSIGLIVGLGYGAAITGVNAISPNMRRPGLYAAVTGSYHAVGLTLCSAIHHWLS